MKILLLTFVFGIATCHPNLYRIKRQTVTESPAEASSSTTTTTSSTSTSSPSQSGQSPDFGIGAAAGFGGNGYTAGIGNFQADTRKNPFLPFGAFAGLNLGQGQRIGAGCSGLSCGFQLGDLVFATPQLFGLGQNFGSQQGNQGGSNGLTASSGFGNYPYYNYNNNPYPYYNFPNYQPFQQQSFPSLNQYDNSQQQMPQQNFPPSLADFARMGNGASSFSFGSTNNNGKEVYTSTSVQSEPDGKVTTIHKGSGQPDLIDARMGRPGSNGVYAASGVNVDSNGKVSSYRAGGSI